MLNALEQYYREKCDGLWEHNYGFTLESCDNPGWMLNIKDPRLFQVLDSLNKKGEIPDSIGMRMGCPEWSEVILFAEHLHPLSACVKRLMADVHGI